MRPIDFCEEEAMFRVKRCVPRRRDAWKGCREGKDAGEEMRAKDSLGDWGAD